MSRSLLLEWEQPLPDRRNGIITGYIITIQQLAAAGFYQTLNSTGMNSMRVDNLHPHTTYEYQIAAYTIIGIGPYTDFSLIKTLEDGECI